MHSLEFYLLQFHVFMTRESSMVLYIIPKEKWGYTNMVIVGLICAAAASPLPATPSTRHAISRRRRAAMHQGARAHERHARDRLALLAGQGLHWRRLDLRDVRDGVPIKFAALFRLTHTG